MSLESIHHMMKTLVHSTTSHIHNLKISGRWLTGQLHIPTALLSTVQSPGTGVGALWVPVSWWIKQQKEKILHIIMETAGCNQSLYQPSYCGSYI